MDFGKIGRPCTCIVTSSFNGELYVTSHKTTSVLCKNGVTVNKTVIFNCKDGGGFWSRDGEVDRRVLFLLRRF